MHVSAPVPTPNGGAFVTRAIVNERHRIMSQLVLPMPRALIFGALLGSLLLAPPASATPAPGRLSFRSRVVGHLPKGVQRTFLMRKLHGDKIVAAAAREAASHSIITRKQARRWGWSDVALGTAVIATAVMAPEVLAIDPVLTAEVAGGLFVAKGLLPIRAARRDERHSRALHYRATIIKGQQDAARIGLDSRESALLDGMAAKLR